MLTIRFQRTGKRNRPEFRVVVAPKTAAAQKKFTEILGNYNPRTKAFVVKSQERLMYWLSQRIEISPSVHNLFVSQKLMDAPKQHAFSIPKKVVAKEAATAEVPVQSPEAGVAAGGGESEEGSSVPAPSAGAEPATDAPPEAPVV